MPEGFEGIAGEMQLRPIDNLGRGREIIRVADGSYSVLRAPENYRDYEFLPADATRLEFLGGVVSANRGRLASTLLVTCFAGIILFFRRKLFNVRNNGYLGRGAQEGHLPEDPELLGGPSDGRPEQRGRRMSTSSTACERELGRGRMDGTASRGDMRRRHPSNHSSSYQQVDGPPPTDSEGSSGSSGSSAFLPPAPGSAFPIEDSHQPSTPNGTPCSEQGNRSTNAAIPHNLPLDPEVVAAPGSDSVAPLVQGVAGMGEQGQEVARPARESSTGDMLNLFTRITSETG